MLSKKEIKNEYNKLVEDLEQLKRWLPILGYEERLSYDIDIDKHMFAITILERILEK